MNTPKRGTLAPLFRVGDGATFTLYTDRQACTVIKVSPSGKTITLRYDKQKLLNGPSSGEPDALTVHPGGFAMHVTGRQRWHTEPDLDGTVIKASLRTLPSGRQVWKQTGHPTRSPGCSVTPGRHPYYDYNY